MIRVALLAQRPLREYEAEPDLARAVQAAMSREASGQAGKPLLHLVVLGHVDAGKSTLMGRLLHDLGCAPTARYLHARSRSACSMHMLMSSISLQWHTVHTT